MKKGELIATLNQFLVEQYAAGRKVLLIVDEAQNLSLRVLEEVRLLSGVETTKDKVLRIILAGQPELNDKLDAPELVQLAQRIRLRFHLGTLSLEDMRAYIQHRLEVAGGADREIFAEDTFGEIYRYSGGVPRLINTLCDTSLKSLGQRDPAHALRSHVVFPARADQIAAHHRLNRQRLQSSHDDGAPLEERQVLRVPHGARERPTAQMVRHKVAGLREPEI